MRKIWIWNYIKFTWNGEFFKIIIFEITYDRTSVKNNVGRVIFGIFSFSIPSNKRATFAVFLVSPSPLLFRFWYCIGFKQWMEILRVTPLHVTGIVDKHAEITVTPITSHAATDRGDLWPVTPENSFIIFIIRHRFNLVDKYGVINVSDKCAGMITRCYNHDRGLHVRTWID